MNQHLTTNCGDRELFLKINHIHLMQAVDFESNRQDIFKYPSRSIVIAVSPEVNYHTKFGAV